MVARHLALSFSYHRDLIKTDFAMSVARVDEHKMDDLEGLKSVDALQTTTEVKEWVNAPTPYSPEEDRRVVRKFDLHILPLIWLCYFFNSLDRSNVSNAKSDGMTGESYLHRTGGRDHADTLFISGSQFSRKRIRHHAFGILRSFQYTRSP